jgi:hypothetical protein
MKQVLENFRTGECYVEDVPAPVAGENFVLVRNCYSLISSGTEGGTVKLGKMSLLGKARARPEQVRKVLQVVKTQGLAVAWNAAMRTLDMPIVLGYSTAGVVIGKGRQVDHVEIGDRVACGGAGYANHAEIVCVPKNLCVRIPEGAATREAAFTTLGAIALQSVRVARAQLGDNVVLIGLGLVGLITAQLLKAAGCRVFGIDIDPERVAFLKSGRSGDGEVLGAGNLKERVMAWTSGKGAAGGSARDLSVQGTGALHLDGLRPRHRRSGLRTEGRGLSLWLCTMDGRPEHGGGAGVSGVGGDKFQRDDHP